MIYLLIAMYLSAIVLANLSIVVIGPQMAIWNAFILISLDLTARDTLHEHWHRRRLWPKMFTLIAAGSILSWWLNADAGRVALASFLAFNSAGLSDAGMYQVLGERSRLVKMNGSNVVSAALDTIVFVLIAGLPLWIIPAQYLAKIIGGLFWSMALERFRHKMATQ